MEAMVVDSSVGGYSITIDLSSDIKTRGKFPCAFVSARYPAGLPVVAIKYYDTSKIVITSNVSVKNAAIQWMYINTI